MLKWVTVICFVLAAANARAATIVDFTGNSTGAFAAGTATISLAADGSSITGSITNTALFDARITAFGFDLGSGNIAGFTGAPNLTGPGDADFYFSDGDFGNVAQFNGTDLDFGYLTGKKFNGGSPNDGLDNFLTLNFMISGPFGNLTEAEIASALVVRFQRVGANGQASDVAVVSGNGTAPVIPEPASMILFGTGLLALARKRLRRQNP
jgi:hypothetical protein